MEHLSDEQLVLEYRAGKEAALEVLFARYLRSIYNLAYGYARYLGEADDIAQQVFIKVWKNLKKFDQAKRFRPWIFKIAKNTALDFVKQKHLIAFSELANADGSNSWLDNLPTLNSGEASDVAKAVDRNLSNNIIAGALEKLPTIYKIVLTLRIEKDFSFREIAEYLNEPLNTVKSRYRRALSLLKKSLA